MPYIKRRAGGWRRPIGAGHTANGGRSQFNSQMSSAARAQCDSGPAPTALGDGATVSAAQPGLELLGCEVARAYRSATR